MKKQDMSTPSSASPVQVRRTSSILKAFETGADGLALVTCPKNECHYLEGNLRAPKRVEEANCLLEEAGMGE
jgi:coenzyme F420-reducing hydrogenase delta subunit